MKKKYPIKAKLKSFLKNNFLILILILLFFLIKVSYLLKIHSVIWDEAVYIGMGKYLFSLGNIGLWEIIRPIGLPLILGVIWKSGLNLILFSEFISILFAIGSIILVYLIGNSIANKRFGFISSFILAITSVFFLYTNYLLTEIPSTFFILFGIYIYLKKHNMFLAGILCGIAALFKFPQGLILISFIITIFISMKNKDIKIFFKKSFLFISGFFLIHIPFFIFNYLIYNKDTSKIYHAMFRPWILASSHQFNPAESIVLNTFGSYLYNIFYYIINMFIENTLLIFLIPGLIFIIKKRLYRKKSFSIISISFLTFLFYLTYISNKQTRFLILLLPYASLIAAYGFYHLFINAKKDRVRILIVIFVIISLMGVISRDLNYSNWRGNEELPIVKNYYKFFADKQINGPILTADPVPVAYVDAKFIPFYFSLDTAYDIYESNKEEAFALIFSPESFYCDKNDQNCKDLLKNLQESIEKKYELVYSEIYWDRFYYVYLNKDLK